MSGDVPTHRLNNVDVARLSDSAARLRAALRCVVLACERIGLPPPELTAVWPVRGRRRGGWARATESEQVQDERLLTVIDVGLAAAARLHEYAPLDPLVRLAGSSFRAAAARYDADSRALHESLCDPSIALHDAASNHRAGAARLVIEIGNAAAAERSMLGTRLVPAAITTGAYRVVDDLELIGNAPSDEHLVYGFQLARDLDGLLGLVGDHAPRLPESVLMAAESAAGSLERWDRATGSFRLEVARDPVGTFGVHQLPTDAYRAEEPEAWRCAHAAGELGWRLGETLDSAMYQRDGQMTDTVRRLVVEARALRDGHLAPLRLPAVDDVYRDEATRVAGTLMLLAADARDSNDPDQHALSRSALRARAAALNYLEASDALAARVRREIGTTASSPGTVLPSVGAAFVVAHDLLVGEPIGDVAIAEMSALRRDLHRAMEAYDARPGVVPGGQLVSIFGRRLADSVHALMAGDAGAHLALRPGGEEALRSLGRAGDGLDALLGVRHPALDATERGVRGWLAESRRDARTAAAPRLSRPVLRGRALHGRLRGVDGARGHNMPGG